MIISQNSNISFKGYDAIPLRGFFMQGFCNDEINIFKEMKSIAKKEGLDIFVSQDNTKITQQEKFYDEGERVLPRWAQDNKAFVFNKNGKTILHNSKEPTLEEKSLRKLSDFKIDEKKYMPRGGDYYLGHKENNDKWLIINGMSVTDPETFKKCGDLPTIKHLEKLFDVKPENIHIITDFTNDIDEIIRPIGYPNVLVNDYRLSLENLEKMKKKFPDCDKTYNEIKQYILKKIEEENISIEGVPNADKLCQILEEHGFNPIKIGARYNWDINYINAIAFKNKKNGLTYISNSTKDSYPELAYLEKLFEKDFKRKVPEITNTYFVSGGKKEIKETVPGLYALLDRLFEKRGLKKENIMMSILAKKGGGIHCMTAEIPDFDRIC